MQVFRISKMFRFAKYTQLLAFLIADTSIVPFDGMLSFSYGHNAFFKRLLGSFQNDLGDF